MEFSTKRHDKKNVKTNDLHDASPPDCLKNIPQESNNQSRGRKTQTFWSYKENWSKQRYANKQQSLYLVFEQTEKQKRVNTNRSRGVSTKAHNINKQEKAKVQKLQTIDKKD